MKKTLSLLAIVLATAATSFAGQACSKKLVVPADDCRFRANEWQVDMSAVGGSGLYGGNTEQWLGGDLGVNYFWSKYFGVGVDNSIVVCSSSGNTAVGADVLQADLIARYPICSLNLAPYAMVGGGAHWGNRTQGNGNVGGGLEYRFTHNVGVFADCRWLYGDNGNMALTMAMPRVGVRLAF